MVLPKGYAVLDLETSGLNPASCRITELAALLVLPGKEPAVESRLVKIEEPLLPEIVKLTGITDELLQEDGIAIEDAILWFLDRVEGLQLVGHNVFRFDQIFLVNEAVRSRATMDPHDDFRVGRFLDTAAIYKGLKLGFRRRKTESHYQYATRILNTKRQGLYYHLEAACDDLGIPSDDVQRHRAAGDATLTYRLFEALLKQLGVK